jgi:hypothetical protein
LELSQAADVIGVCVRDEDVAHFVMADAEPRELSENRCAGFGEACVDHRGDAVADENCRPSDYPLELVD